MVDMEKIDLREIKDRNSWNSYIQAVAPHAFFQSWEWGDVEQMNGHKVSRYGVYEKNKLRGVAQCIETYARRGNYLHVRHGPVLNEWSERYVSATVNLLKKQAKVADLGFVRISPLIKTEQARPLQELGFKKASMHNIDGEICYVIDLRRELSEILASMRKNTRYIIRKSERVDNFETVKGTSSQQIDDFLVLFQKTAKRRGFVGERGIKKEVSVFASQDNAEIVLTYYKKRPVAGALIVFWGNQGIYHHAATSKLGLQLFAAYRVVWEAIKDTKKRGLDFFNLWGGIPDVGDKSHPWWGLTIFKRGFGSEKREYVHAMDLPLSPKYWRNYFLETAIRYIRGYDSILGFRAPTFFRELFKV